MLLSSALVLTACSDLDQEPKTDISGSIVYATTEGCNQALAKVYASFITVGQSKSGYADFSTNSGHDLMRCYINMQEGPTEEMAASWLAGENMSNLTYMTWNENDPWVSDTYYRAFYTVALANDVIKNTKGSSDYTIEMCSYEARFLRAMAYYMLLDLYGQVPYITEDNTDKAPAAVSSSQLYRNIKAELSELTTLLYPTPHEYGRVSANAAYALLAKLCLNANVYLNDKRDQPLADSEVTSELQDCINACKAIEFCSIHDNYAELFNADNDKRTDEIILPLCVNGDKTVSWGATTMLVCGAIGNSNNQVAADYGASSGWGNFRLRGQLADLFTTDDKRAMFYTADSKSRYTSESTIDDQNYGYFGTKFTNLTDNGEAASNTAEDGVCTDFPMLRYADILLTQGEAMARLGKSGSEILPVIEKVAERAGISYKADDINVAFFLAERGRELWWECTRRTDLIRYGVFGGKEYVWDWKGGNATGTAPSLTNPNVYPLPYSELSANPNLSNDWLK